MAGRASRIVAIKFFGPWLGMGSMQNNDLEKRGSMTTNQNAGSEFASDARDSNAASCQLTQSKELAKELAIYKCQRQITNLMLDKGVPGLTVTVAVQGKIVHQKAHGFCDVENQLLCDDDASMRIASISKSLFAATIVAPLYEQQKIDLAASVHSYLTPEEFPRQSYKDKHHDITVQQLLSHTGGIRSYNDVKPEDEPLRPIGSKGSLKIYQNQEQYDRQGFYSRQTFRDVIDALNAFKNDPLVAEPGTYKYTTYGFTLLSAVAQKALQRDDKHKDEQIEDHWVKVLKKDWKMHRTFLDQDEQLIPKRTRYYLRTAYNGALVNAPYADNSVKWAGGGIVSTGGDLVKFGMQLIDCYKDRKDAQLKSDTLKRFWTEVKDSYGLGFKIREPAPLTEVGIEKAVYHLGGAVGASSAFLMYPESEVVVVVLGNLGYVNFLPLSLAIADEFVKAYT